MANLKVKIGKLELQNPILLASGTAGYGEEIAKFIDLDKLGGIVTKSISLEPRIGNEPMRVTETSAGMLNSIGLANVGLKKFVKEKIPFLKELKCKVICNIAASSVEEYVKCVEVLNVEEAIDAFEINVSCPNVKDGGLLLGNNLDLVAEITEKTRKATEKTLIVKLSPNVSDIWKFAKVVKDNGGDAVTAINTLVGAAFDVRTRKPKIKNVTGGLSGPAIKPVAIAKVYEISKNVDIPIVGVGGITNYEDVLEFMIAGATAVELGTVNFINPTASIEILNSLESYCEENNIGSITELIGSYKVDD